MPATQVLPVNGSREALFAFAQTVIDPARRRRRSWSARIPFYQIYEGAALLAGAEPYFVNQRPGAQLRGRLGQRARRRSGRATQLLFVCSPGNPTGAVMPLDEWQQAVRAVATATAS